MIFLVFNLDFLVFSGDEHSGHIDQAKQNTKPLSCEAEE